MDRTIFLQWATVGGDAITAAQKKNLITPTGSAPFVMCHFATTKMNVLKNFIETKLSSILAIINFILCNYLLNAFLIK